MDICQHIHCNNPAAIGPGNTGKYCSLSCGAKQAALDRKLKKMDNYAANSIPCLHCSNPIPYGKHKSNKFCCSSCAASYNNALKDYTKIKTGPKPKPPEIKEKLKLEKPPKPPKIRVCTICGGEHTRSGKTCSPVCYSKALSNNAKASGLGGNKNTRAYGWYESPSAGRVWLESSYEYRVAKELDDNNVVWTRPKYLHYSIGGKNKKYFPDFYLVEYNVYLDPKNDYLIVQDTPKIIQVIKENNVQVLILDKSQLKWETIKALFHTITSQSLNTSYTRGKLSWPN